jgi:ATP-dependent DNA helicase RecQ
LSRPGVIVQPRKMWPSALANLGLGLKGRISDQADEGRAVARLTDLGHGQALRELFREGAGDTPVPAPLARAVVDVLNDWRPHVDAIVYVESARRPTLTSDLAEGMSRFLKKPVVGRWAIVDDSISPGQGSMNSAQRVSAVSRRCALQAESVEGATVLLVDDLVDTGWTLTLAARALREAGAAGVLPLTLGVQA